MRPVRAGLFFPAFPRSLPVLQRRHPRVALEHPEEVLALPVSHALRDIRGAQVSGRYLYYTVYAALVKYMFRRGHKTRGTEF